MKYFLAYSVVPLVTGLTVGSLVASGFYLSAIVFGAIGCAVNFEIGFRES